MMQAIGCIIQQLEWQYMKGNRQVTVKKDNDPAPVQAAMKNVAEWNSSSAAGGLIQTTSG